MSNSNFTVNDVFEEESSDFVKLYGSTSYSFKSPLENPINSNINALGGTSGTNRINEIKTKLSFETGSRDSDSLIQSERCQRRSLDMKWWHHPKIKEHWKIVLAAITLLFIGIGLLITGIIVATSSGGLQSFVFIIAGAICFIPGAYHVVYIYLAIKGRRGYDFYNLPLFN